jgi:endonuclease/exonuclease/phosphatase family metal-dependent hydrolase
MARFRVLQFNIQFGQVWDDIWPDRAPVRLEAAMEEIRRQEADLVILQEVERALLDGEQANPPPNYTRLRHEFGDYDGWFSYPRPDPRELPFGIGLAILSRTPLTHQVRHDLASPLIEFNFFGRRTTPTDRLLIGARTVIAGRELQVFNTHLLAFFMLGADGELRTEQRREVAALAGQSTLPTLVAGDFNVSNHRALIADFAAQGFQTVQDREITWRRRPYVLDHIFHRAGLAVRAHRVVPTPASDHHALVADFEWVG